MNAQEVYEGSVLWFDAGKGYGFIAAPAAADIFVHISSLEASGMGPLNAGDVVSYEILTDKGGRKKAVSLELIRASAVAAPSRRLADAWGSR